MIAWAPVLSPRPLPKWRRPSVSAGYREGQVQPGDYVWWYQGPAECSWRDVTGLVSDLVHTTFMLSPALWPVLIHPNSPDVTSLVAGILPHVPKPKDKAKGKKTTGWAPQDVVCCIREDAEDCVVFASTKPSPSSTYSSRISGKRIHGERINGDQISGEQINRDQITGSRINGEQITGEKINGERAHAIGTLLPASCSR